MYIIIIVKILSYKTKINFIHEKDKLKKCCLPYVDQKQVL